jgi:hypothetical protein
MKQFFRGSSQVGFDTINIGLPRIEATIVR